MALARLYYGLQPHDTFPFYFSELTIGIPDNPVAVGQLNGGIGTILDGNPIAKNVFALAWIRVRGQVLGFYRDCDTVCRLNFHEYRE